MSTIRKSQSSQAQAASMIRNELKKAFPTVKFRVTSQSFSMGDSVDVRWENGPTSEQVKNITSKYQYGSFDGMTDCYDYTNKRNDIPQSKYVHEQRSITDDIYHEAFKYICNKWECFKEKNIDDAGEDIMKQLSYWTAREFLSRQLCKINLTNGLTQKTLDNVIYHR